MALIKSICGKCELPIGISTEIKAVGNDPWCIDCYNKHSNPPVLASPTPKGYLTSSKTVLNNADSIHCLLSAAYWYPKKKPGEQSGSLFAIETTLWTNRKTGTPHYKLMEVWENGDWRFWGKKGLNDLQIEASGPFALWPNLWANVIRQHSPKP